MSADNTMIVRPYKKKWCAYMQLGDEPYTDDEAKKNYWFKTYKNKDLAIKYAQTICCTEVVEHGLQIEGL